MFFFFFLIIIFEANDSLKGFGLCGKVHCKKLKHKLIKAPVKSRRCGFSHLGGELLGDAGLATAIPAFLHVPGAAQLSEVCRPLQISLKPTDEMMLRLYSREVPSLVHISI